MMHEEIFTSELFTFTLGHEGKDIVVHSEAIARLSPTLNTLIRGSLGGSLRESQGKIVKWDDVEAGDFIRLCQFAYTGDYSPAEPLLKELACEEENTDDVAAVPAPEFPTEFDSPCFHLSSGKDRKKKRKSFHESTGSKKTEKRTQFQSKVFSENRTWNNPDSLYRLTTNTDPRQDFTPVFLSHAQLYVFGNKYGIDNLTSLALCKLHQTLKLFRLYQQRINDVIELVRYTYNNTLGSANDALRVLVTEYIVSEIDAIGKSAAFKLLLEEGGEFVVDFWELTRNHLL